MISVREIALGIYGAWRLAHFDRSGMQFFENTVDAFWKSFAAAIIVLPAFALLRMLTIVANPDAAPPAHPARVIAVFGIAYVISWVAFPLVMVKLADLLDRRERYIPLIVASNWSSIIQMAVALPAATLVAIGGSDVTLVIYLAATAAIWVYGWFIVRTALDVPGLVAVGIVGLSLMLSLLINRVGDVMVGRI